MTSGPILCPLHARQVVHDHQPPSGDCWPHASWLGPGRTRVECDSLARPELVMAFLAKPHRTPSSDVAAPFRSDRKRR